ncbi:hypothetical protein JIQ42_06679 [Leishmania sp. Namibia]|uniref:hypothetical protein n=1 Tax=Leishmania sp. Namibia TaxID=2802991 RepID=UPI001B71931A|nr:hypothetical protein JIQ42_06679 [Leishmania sp. Namibia]
MSMSQFYTLHGVYGGLREVPPAAVMTKQSLNNRCGTVESVTLDQPSPNAASDYARTTDPPGAAKLMVTCSTAALPVNSQAHSSHRRIPDDHTFWVTPDAELCARHHTSLAQVWDCQARLSRQQSSHFPRALTSGAPSERGRRKLEEAAGTTLERNARCPFRRPCTAADLLHSGWRPTPPLPLAGSGGDARVRVSTAAVAAASSTHNSIPTSLRSLDAGLLGGLRRGWVTELTGLPGTGKTTLAAAWCRSCLRHTTSCGIVNGCVWLQSGSTVDSAVLAIAQDVSVTELLPLADAVHVAFLASLDDFQQLIDRWQATDVSRSPLSTVGLIVLDSITDLVRRSFRYRDDDALQRHDALATTLQSLKRLAEKQHVAVLVITQQQRHPSPTFTRSAVSRTSRGTDEEDGNEDEDDGEAWGSEYGRRGSEGVGVASPDACSRNSSAEDAGQLGRLFFHNVNVRLQLRAGVPCAGCRLSSRTPFDAGEGEGRTMRLRWQLEVLKSPVCAPFAVALRLRAPSCLWCPDAPPRVPGLPLSVEEIDGEDGGSGAVVPLAPSTEFEEGLALFSLEPWDYAEVPFFLYR